MVEYTKEQANPSELASGYTDEGYTEVFNDPGMMRDNMMRSGITVERSSKLKTSNDKVQTGGNPRLNREKILRKLFLQYLIKYLQQDMKKFIDHPKQIKNLPSWFDDAIVLFRDDEISRQQKKMIREFFYSLLQYRDSLMIDKGQYTNTEEANRQLGERSPYSETGGLNINEQPFKKNDELRNVDINQLMRNTRELRRPSEPSPFDEEMNLPTTIIRDTKGKATFGQLGLGRVNESNSTVDDYVKFNKSEQVMPGELQSNPVQKPVQTNVNPTANMLRSNKGAGIRTGSGSTAGTGAFNVGRSMLGGIFGNMNRNQMLGAVGLPGQKVQNTPTVVSQATVERRRRKAKIKMNRKLKKKNPLTIDDKSTNTISKVLRNVNNMSTAKLKPLKQTTINPSKMKPMNDSTKKSISGLATVRNMDKLFTQIKSVSSKEFGRENMKMAVVSNIKDQCDKAFAKNKFKQESMKMKKNYFSDVKAAYPQMKLDIEEMGDIKENHMMNRSMHDVPRIINSRRTTSSLMVGRGDMRPQSMGIVEYDFSIEPLGKKKSKKLELFDEDDFIERSR